MYKAFTVSESEVLGTSREANRRIKLGRFVQTNRKILKDYGYTKEEVPNDRSSFRETLRTQILVANSRRKSIWPKTI